MGEERPQINLNLSLQIKVKMNFGDILEDVSHGNFSSVAELNNFKQVDKDHIMEIYSRDIRSKKEKADWIADIEEDWKPEIVNLIKDVYSADITSKRYKLLSLTKQSQDDLLSTDKLEDDHENIYGYGVPEDKYSKMSSPELTRKSVPEFKTIPLLFRGTDESAGHDISSLVEVTIPARSFASVETGVHISIPKGYHVDVRPRSGLGFRNQVVAFNGVIDSDYSSVNPDDARCVNTVKVGMFNFSDSDYTVKVGDRIAQLVICQNFQFSNSIIGDSTSHNGFGSTGL